MAALTATLDTGSPNYKTGHITGTFDSTDYMGATAAQSVPDEVYLMPSTNPLTYCNVWCEDGPAAARVVINYDDDGSALAGTFLFEPNDPESRTYRFEAGFIGC